MVIFSAETRPLYSVVKNIFWMTSSNLPNGSNFSKKVSLKRELKKVINYHRARIMKTVIVVC